jgi:hypothetical protein
MDDHESPLTRRYWEKTLREGTLYAEFPIVKRQQGVQPRRVDGLVVLGTPSHYVPKGEDGRDERAAANLNDKDVVVIQTKATRLNPYVFGQALLSMDLIRQRWRPRSLRAVLICVEEDPELTPIVARYEDLTMAIEPPVGKKQRPPDHRLPGAAATVARRLDGFAVAPAQVGRYVRIDGVVIPRERASEGSLQQAVRGCDVVSVHSYRPSAGAKRAGFGMYVGGEVIMAQALLAQMGAKSVRSVVIADRGDAAVEEAMVQRGVDFEVQKP